MHGIVAAQAADHLAGRIGDVDLDHARAGRGHGVVDDHAVWRIGGHRLVVRQRRAGELRRMDAHGVRHREQPRAGPGVGRHVSQGRDVVP